MTLQAPEHERRWCYVVPELEAGLEEDDSELLDGLDSPAGLDSVDLDSLFDSVEVSEAGLSEPELEDDFDA